MHAPSTTWRPLALVLAALLVLAGCAAASAPAPDEAGADNDRGMPADDEQRDTDGLTPDGYFDGYAAPYEQRIIKTGEITIEVANVGETLGRVRAMATELDGYVGGSQAGTLSQSATLTLRIPAARFDDALARLHEMDAEVKAEATREQDVTSQVVDLEARIRNLEASEVSYRGLLDRAEKIEDILAVQSRLDQVRGEIEQLKAQLKAVSDQAALATLTVTILPRPTPVQEQTSTWDPGAQLDQALAALVGIGQGLVGGLIWFGVVILPILLGLGMLVLLALRGLLEVRRRMPVSSSGAGEPPTA